MSEAIVWAEPIKRGDLCLAPGDIEEALTWFKESTRQEAKLFILNPKNEYLAPEANGIKVIYLDGCLPWEIWLSPSNSFRTENPRIQESLESKSSPFKIEPKEMYVDNLITLYISLLFG